MQPRWIKYPKIKRGSIGWRMGGGEDYSRVWLEWYLQLDDSEQAAYRNQYPNPFGWWGFYKSIKK